MMIYLLCGLALWLWLPAKTENTQQLRGAWRFPWRTVKSHKSKESDALAENARIVRELSALLRSGLGFYPAVELLLETHKTTCPVRGELQQLQASHRLNDSGSLAVSDEAAHLDLSVRKLSWCLSISARSGASLADVLERLADDLEANLIAAQSFDAAMAGPKATTKLLTWLPLVGFGAGILLGIDVLQTLMSSWAAQLSVILGIVLWLVNRWWCSYLLQTTSRRALS